MAATPVVTHSVMPLNEEITTVAITASATVTSTDRGILITFIIASLLAIILDSIGRWLIVAAPDPLVVLVLVAVV